MDVITDNELDMIFKQGVSESYAAGLRSLWLAGYETGKGVTLGGDVSVTGFSETEIDATPIIYTP